MNNLDSDRPTDSCEQSSPDAAGCGCPVQGGGKALLLGLLVLAGIYYLVNRELSFQQSPASTSITWEGDYGRAITQAAQKNQPVLLAFEATWCGPCKWMENEVFSKPAVAKALANWVTVHIDVDKSRDLSKQYQIEAMPTFIALSPAGKEVNRATGALPLDEFVSFLAATQAKIPAPAQ